MIVPKPLTKEEKSFIRRWKGKEISDRERVDWLQRWHGFAIRPLLCEHEKNICCLDMSLREAIDAAIRAKAKK